MWDLLPVFIFVVALVAVVLGVGNEMLQRWLTHKEKAMELMATKTAEQAAQYASKAQQLEARVRVLERIATDRGADLALEIEDLRDRAPAEESMQ